MSTCQNISVKYLGLVSIYVSLNHKPLSFSRRSPLLSWSSLLLPQQPVPARLWSCSCCDTLRCWRSCVRSCGVVACCMTAVCARVNCDWTASLASSTWTAWSKRSCVCLPPCPEVTALPHRPLSWMWVVEDLQLFQPKYKNSGIIYSPSCCSKQVWNTIFLWETCSDVLNGKKVSIQVPVRPQSL